MAYIDVIPLATAKNYLRVDDDLTEDDARITSFISTALSIVEKYTNVYVFARDKEFFFDESGCVLVYDYPINSLVSPTDAERTEKQLYSIYATSNPEDTKLTLNVGYSDPADVPTGIIDDALNFIKYMYYEAETNKANNGDLPMWLKLSLDQKKRFII